MAAQVEGHIVPAMPVHALRPVHPTVPLPSTRSSPLSSSESSPLSYPTDISRSASYTYIPALEKEPAIPSIRRTFSENVLSVPPETKSKMTSSALAANKELFRRASRKAKKRMSSAMFSMSPDDDEASIHDGKKSGMEKIEQPKSLSRSVTGTIRTLARRSWAGSRSSSPAQKGSGSQVRKRSWSPKKDLDIPAGDSNIVDDSYDSNSPSPHRKVDLTLIQTPNGEFQTQETETISEPAQKPLTSLYTKNKSEISLRRFSRNSSSTSLGSNEKSQSRISLGRVPPLPRSLSADRLAALNIDVVKKKDPLWTAFRAIDGELANFQARTSLQKTKVLRTILLPFLQKHAQHASNKTLRAEDLDRRTVILNRWWTAILEMLHGANNQSISGTDRPAFLESASMIMLRPEWRVPGYGSVSGESPSRSSLPKSKSTNSLESEEADFLVDTIHQNVRTSFVQNLLSQMAFVVDKLAWRIAPSSLVTFAGKTCAYAFFFCPGVADMLTRLWRLPSGTMNRVFSQFGIGYGDKLDLISNALAGNFPPPARSLCVTTQAALSRYLQPRNQIPPGSETVNWWDRTWIRRWTGRDTDLFFAFTKFYHLLVSEFLPEDISLKDRAGIPGLVPVCAQMLAVLETTIHRQQGQHAMDDDFAGPGFDRENPDASAPLPMTIANADRLIAENRLIILLRDILGDFSPEFSLFRTLFIGSFDNITKAAALRTSMYDHDACFVLCDFLEEVLPIMFRYHLNYSDTPVLDWPFWLDVFTKMMQSEATMTQIRLIALVYNKWSILILNDERKRDLVLGWLLHPQVFERIFCHWAPMVRHYYYRLLCWRVARCDGPVTDVDIEILETLAARLNKCWAHYQYLYAEAEMRELLAPSSAPCYPAPSRALVIMRTDSQPLLTPSRTTMERQNAALINQNSPYQNHSSALNMIPSADVPPPGSKKRWSLFRGLNVFGATPGNNRPGEVTPPGSPEESGSKLAGENDPGPNSAITSPTPVSRPVTPPHQTFSFKFSLEYYPSRPNLENKNRILSTPQLPPNAQSILRARQSIESEQSDQSNQSNPSSQSNGSAHSAGYGAKMRLKRTEVRPLKPKGHEVPPTRYGGRALAEWAQIVHECRGFYTRRKQEGVPRDNLVETPMMEIANFRMMG